MVHSNSAVGGKSFYQSEPLIARLRGIIRDYPEGVGILKELIQNADDARATRVEITLDWRTHKANQLPGDRMVQLLGPAMLVYNDRVFSDRDFNSIRSLGQSEKAQDLQKTGRFGVGFNAVYHVTDYPSFISRRSLIFFDPHGSAIPGTSRQEPGREWSFAEEGWYDKYPEFMKVYEAGGLPFGVEDFKGTLFRLPLRTEEHAKDSEIRKQAFSETNVRELLQELIQVGEELLLFLKSVREIRVYEIPANSDGTRQEIFTVITKNKQEVGEARQKIFDALPDDPETLLKLCRDNSDALISVSYRHEIETISRDRTTNSTWRVVSVIRTDQENELARVIEAMHQSQEKVVPWAGAAARISASSTDGNPKPVKGRVYCFLPLPLESELPVHINGFFNLNSSRDNLSSDSGQTGKDRPRAIWNQLLVRHVLSHAYANLITDLVQDIGRYNPEEFYKLFPVRKITVSKALEDLPRFVIQLLYHNKVIRSAVEHAVSEIQNGTKVISSTRWLTPPTVKVLSGDWWKKLVEPLRADNIDIPDPPLPTSIVTAFKEAGCPLDTFTPANLRQHLAETKPLGVPLQDAPKASLCNRQWIVDMLRYCLSDNHKDLRGLPLAILANDTLQVFGYNPIGTIYIADEGARQIFANYPEWFLHRDLSNLVSPYYQIGVSNMDATEVAKKLVNVIGTTQSGEYQWQPDSPTPPNTDWLTLVYRYFTNVYHTPLPLEELKKVPLVPGDDGKLYKGENAKTPLLCGTDIDAETVAAVQYFGVTLVKAPEELEKAIAQFSNHHPDKLILSLTGSTLTDAIYSRYAKGLPPYDQKHYTSILNFIAKHRKITEIHNDQDRKNKLRQLAIYPTNTNEIVTLNDEDVYIPGDGYQPPEIAGTLRLLRLGKTKKEWLQLFQMLGVPVLNRARLIQDCLLREYASFAYEEQLTALAWIRDNLSKAGEELEGEPQTFTVLKAEIKKARLVRCTDGRLRSAELIYSPESEVVRNILGNKAAIPDMEFYSQDSGLWLDFFESLGMRQSPSTDDLLGCVDTLIQKAFQAGSDAVADSILAVFNYIVENWNEFKSARLTNSNITLPEALQDKAWLPVERNPETLKQYIGAVTPEPMLYRAKDICFIQDAHLVASQKPIFARQKQDLLTVEIRNALGFHPVEPNLVIDHLDAAIKTWENNSETTVSEANLQSVKAIYEYLYNTFVDGSATDEQRRQVKERFESRQCLWDDSTGKFWEPIHAFQDDVPFFGSRRVTIPFSHRTGEVYQLLGQKRSPNVEDYLDFLQELAAEYNNTTLAEEDKSHVVQVLNRLESQLMLEGRSAQNIPVLTADNQLRPANEVFIPDAPWRKDYIDRNRILHPEVSPKLAKAAGSLSLLRDAIERPIDVNSAIGTKGNEWCQEWQRTLNSPEFILGVKRLIFHEHDSEPILDLIWLSKAKVLPANQIKVDLFLKDETRIAAAIPGTYYFDEFQRIFHVTCSGSRYIMLCYLAESLNNQLGQYAVQNLLPLASIIDTEPKNIRSLLNELRIRSLPGASTQETTSNSEEQEDNSNTAPIAPMATRTFDSSIYWGAYE